MITAAIPGAMLLPTDECFAQEVLGPVYDGPTCPKYALWDSNTGSWLVKEQKSRLWRYVVTALERSGLALSSIYTGLVASGW